MSEVMRERKEQIPKEILQGDFFDDEESIFTEEDVYEAGSQSAILKDLLTRMANFYIEDPRERQRIQALIKWFPGERMEEFIVLSLQYAADKVMPPSKTRQRRRQ